MNATTTLAYGVLNATGIENKAVWFAHFQKTAEDLKGFASDFG